MVLIWGSESHRCVGKILRKNVFRKTNSQTFEDTKTTRRLRKIFMYLMNRDSSVIIHEVWIYVFGKITRHNHNSYLIHPLALTLTEGLSSRTFMIPISASCAATSSKKIEPTQRLRTKKLGATFLYALVGMCQKIISGTLWKKKIKIVLHSKLKVGAINLLLLLSS